MKTKPVVAEQIVNAPVAKVWDALTDKKEMDKWYFNMNKFKPEVGFQFQFEAGNDEKKWLHICKITEVINEKKLSYSWRYNGYPGESLVTFELIPDDNTTMVRVVHEGLENFPQDVPDFHKENFEKGWNQILGTSLKKYVEAVK